MDHSIRTRREQRANFRFQFGYARHATHHVFKLSKSIRINLFYWTNQQPFKNHRRPWSYLSTPEITQETLQSKSSWCWKSCSSKSRENGDFIPSQVLLFRIHQWILWKIRSWCIFSRLVIGQQIGIISSIPKSNFPLSIPRRIKVSPTLN